jgi:hypothetical protein
MLLNPPKYLRERRGFESNTSDPVAAPSRRLLQDLQYRRPAKRQPFCHLPTGLSGLIRLHHSSPQPGSDLPPLPGGETNDGDLSVTCASSCTEVVLPPLKTAVQSPDFSPSSSIESTFRSVVACTRRSASSCEAGSLSAMSGSESVCGTAVSGELVGVPSGAPGLLPTNEVSS